jgi:hypothetical protein
MPSDLQGLTVRSLQNQRMAEKPQRRYRSNQRGETARSIVSDRQNDRSWRRIAHLDPHARGGGFLAASDHRVKLVCVVCVESGASDVPKSLRIL